MANHSDLSNAVSNFTRTIEADRKALQSARIALELADDAAKSIVRRAVDQLAASVDAAEAMVPELHAELAQLEQLEAEHRAASVAFEDASKVLAAGAASVAAVAKLQAAKEGAAGVLRFVDSKLKAAVLRLGQRASHPSVQPSGAGRLAKRGTERAAAFLQAFKAHGHELEHGYAFAKAAADLVSGTEGAVLPHFVAGLVNALATYQEQPKRPKRVLAEQVNRAIAFIVMSAKKPAAQTVAA